MQHPQFSHPLMVSCLTVAFEEDGPGHGSRVLALLERELLHSGQGTNPCRVPKGFFVPQQEHRQEKWDLIPRVLLKGKQ